MRCDRSDGHITETAHPGQYHRAFSAPWIDAVLHQAGMIPGRRNRGRLRMLDLGCGNGRAPDTIACRPANGAWVSKAGTRNRSSAAARHRRAARLVRARRRDI